MQINFTEEKKGKLMFELDGASHTVCNTLKRELWQDKHIKAASYAVKHPLIGKAEFLIETDGEDPKKVMAAGCQRIKKDIEKFSEQLKKEVK